MRPNGRVSALGEPQLVRLLDGTEVPAAASLTDWWKEYGGRLDEATGEIEFPAPVYPPCPVPDCSDCKAEE